MRLDFVQVWVNGMLISCGSQNNFSTMKAPQVLCGRMNTIVNTIQSLNICLSRYLPLDV